MIDVRALRVIDVRALRVIDVRALRVIDVRALRVIDVRALRVIYTVELLTLEFGDEIRPVADAGGHGHVGSVGMYGGRPCVHLQATQRVGVGYIWVWGCGAKGRGRVWAG